MRKIICLLLAVMLALSAASALAAEYVEADLPHADFCGVEPGMTFAEVRDRMDRDIFAQIPYHMIPLTIHDIQTKIPDAEEATTENVYDHFIFSAIGAMDMMGYESSPTVLYFVKPVRDGAVSESDDESILYGACCYFANYQSGRQMKSSEIESDLTEQLVKMYGEPKRSDGMAVWSAANNVEVSLCVNPTCDNVVQLAYVWTTAQPMIEAAFAGADLSNVPEGVEIWIRDENNYALLDPVQNTWTARVGVIGETLTFELTRGEDGRYVLGNNAGEIKPVGDELDVFYYEYGVTRTYHRGTPEEYAEILAQFAKYSDPAWLIGEWKLEYDWEFGDKGDPLVIREDGTCLFQGTEYAWENGVVRGREYFGITLYLNERPQYCILKDADRVQIVSQLTNSFTYIVR